MSLIGKVLGEERQIGQGLLVREVFEVLWRSADVDGERLGVSVVSVACQLGSSRKLIKFRRTDVPRQFQFLRTRAPSGRRTRSRCPDSQWLQVPQMIRPRRTRTLGLLSDNAHRIPSTGCCRCPPSRLRDQLGSIKMLALLLNTQAQLESLLPKHNEEQSHPQHSPSQSHEPTSSNSAKHPGSHPSQPKASNPSDGEHQAVPSKRPSQTAQRGQPPTTWP